MPRLRWFALCVLCLGTAAATPSAALAEGPLLLGVFPRRPAVETTRMFTPLAAHLGRQLGREVKVVTAKDFEAFMEGVKRGEYDLAHLNQYQYVKAHRAFGYDAVAMNEESGSSTLAGTLLVRKDSGIRSAKDLRGKKIIFGGGPTAMMSYVVPTYLLRKAGLKKGDYVEVFGKSPPNAALAVYYGQADAAGTGEVVLTLRSVASQVKGDELTVLETSAQVAQLPWAVKKGTDPALRAKLQGALLGLAKTAEGRELLRGAELTGLQKAEDRDYDAHRAIIAEVLGERY